MEQKITPIGDDNTLEKRKGSHLAAYHFQPGNSGRPKGARSKLGTAFLEAMLSDFTKHGVSVIETVRTEKPDQYLKVVASILPKEIEAGEETLNAIAELMNRVDGRTRTVGLPQHVETVQ